MGISLSPNLVSLEDIPARYVDDPQLALANVRKHVPGVLAPPWVEPAVPPFATVTEVDTLRREAIYQWVVALCRAAGATIVPVNTSVTIALSQARSVPEPIAPVARGDEGDRLLANLRQRRRDS